MKIFTRLARDSDLKEYTDLLQRTYSDAYTDEKLGLTKGRFSKEVFSSKDTQGYLKSQLEVNDKQKTWLAFLDQEMVGAITLKDKGKECELTGFYVAPEHQGKGIGKMLWQLVLKESGDKDITLDTYTHNHKTIDIYKKWGFAIDKEKGTFYRHWPEWPEGLQAECLYMRLCKSNQALEMNPVVYLLCGLPGSGKTTYAKRLEAQGVIRLSSDQIVYKRYGRYGIDYPEDKFRELEEIIRNDLEKELVHLLGEGKSVVLDYGLWKKAGRDYYKSLIKKYGGQWKLVYFKIDPDILLKRVKERNLQRAAYAMPITEEMLKNFIQEFEEPTDEGEELP